MTSFDKKSNIGKILLEVFILTIVIFICQFATRIFFNELDVLPYAYAVYNPDWLSNDWYLNQKIEYRYIFSYLTGFFVHHFGFVNVVIFGRILTYLLFAIAFNQLRRVLQMDFLYALMALIFFLLIFFQTLSANEWMVNGFETKAFAYPFVLMALVNSLKKRYFYAFLFSGLAMSFHLVVGLYGFFCAMIMVLFTMPKSSKAFWATFKELLQKSWIFFLTGSMGCYALSIYLINFLNPALSGNAWEIYVHYRVPHHAYPNLEFKVLALLPLIILLSFVVFKYKKEPWKSFIVYNWAAVFIWLIGLAVYFSGSISMLRFYFFRFADTLLPFTASLFLFMGLETYLNNRPNFQANKKKIKWVLSIIIALVVVGSKAEKGSQLIKPSTYTESDFNSSADAKMMNWIKGNTAKEALFIVPISMSNFYLTAERGVFVSFKHSPQKGEDIKEWYNRMMMLNGNRPIEDHQQFRKEVEANYLHLNEEEISDIKEAYSMDYLLMPHFVDLDLKEVFRTEKYVLYELR